MAVLEPSGTFTVGTRAPARDDHGMPVPGTQANVGWTGLGRVRTNANGVDFALDPEAWPLARVDEENDVVVELSGPDVDGTPRTWIVRSSTLRKGLDADLDELSYIQGYAERVDL